MWIADQWKDYAVLDACAGEKAERWGKYILIRPDPAVLWNSARTDAAWRHADAHYTRSHSGGGSWDENRLPPSWNISYRDLTFTIRPMGFKHTGLFPEQAVNWDWMRSLIEEAGRPVRILNLFAYTGGATVAAAKSGASVCHVDASRGMVSVARENAALSGLADAPIRYIVDDCRKFIEREIRRANRYDGIIIDPPSYGRGPTGQVWKIEECIDDFIALSARVLSPHPLFYLLNSYTTGLSACTMQAMVDLHITQKFKGKSEADEIGLPIGHTGLHLPCGSSVRVCF